MKDKYLVSIFFITFISLICFFMVLSFSAEEEDTIPPTSTVQSTTPEPETETFENWTPDFTNQTTGISSTVNPFNLKQ
jgi:hypothetical protein